MVLILKKQIRFMRPNPQSTMNDIFLRGSKADRTILVMVDGYYKGHPDHIRPDKKVPPIYEDGKAACNKGYEIFETILQQLKDTHWNFFVHTDLGKGQYIKRLEKFSNKKVTNMNWKININKVRSLLAFVPRHGPNDLINTTMLEFQILGKPICIVDNYGIKRYPRMK